MWVFVQASWQGPPLGPDGCQLIVQPGPGQLVPWGQAEGGADLQGVSGCEQVWIMESGPGQLVSWGWPRAQRTSRKGGMN